MSEKRIRLLTNAPVRGVLRSPAEGGGKGILAPIGEASELIDAGKAVDLSEKKAKPARAKAAPKRAAAKSPAPKAADSTSAAATADKPADKPTPPPSAE